MLTPTIPDNTAVELYPTAPSASRLHSRRRSFPEKYYSTYGYGSASASDSAADAKPSPSPPLASTAPSNHEGLRQLDTQSVHSSSTPVASPGGAVLTTDFKDKSEQQFTSSGFGHAGLASRDPLPASPLPRHLQETTEDYTSRVSTPMLFPHCFAIVSDPAFSAYPCVFPAFHEKAL